METVLLVLIKMELIVSYVDQITITIFARFVQDLLLQNVKNVMMVIIWMLIISVFLVNKIVSYVLTLKFVKNVLRVIILLSTLMEINNVLILALPELNPLLPLSIIWIKIYSQLNKLLLHLANPAISTLILLSSPSLLPPV